MTLLCRFSFRPQGKYAEAELLLERRQAIKEKFLGPDHPKVATTLHNRARLLEKQVRTCRTFQDTPFFA